MASKLGVIQLPRKGRSRQGIAIVVALAAITIVVGMLLPLIPPALRARRQCEADEVALQAEMLRHAAFQYGILRWSPDQEAMEESGTLSFGDEASNPEPLKSGAWKIEIRRLSEGARYRIQIVAKIRADMQSEDIQSSSEIEIDRIELESRQKQLLQHPNRT
jgi:hypothetical protein